MNAIERKEIMDMVAIMCAGVFSNPTSVNMLTNQYDRQQLIQQMIRDTVFAVESNGMTIVDSQEVEEEK